MRRRPVWCRARGRRWCRLPWALLLLWLWPTLATATVNFEKRRRALVRPGWAFGLDLHGSVRRGNINVLELGGSEFVGWQTDRRGFLLLGEHRFRAQTLARAGQGFDELPQARQINAHMGHLRLFHRLGRGFSAETFTQVEIDELNVLRWRQLVGAALRYRVLEREAASLHVGTGYVPELEILDRALFVSQPGGYGPVNIWHRMGLVIDASAARGPLTLTNTFYVLPRLDDPADLRLLDEVSLAVMLSEHVSIKLVGSVRLDTRPPSYCATPVPAGGCPPERLRRVIPIELAVDPALAVSF